MTVGELVKVYFLIRGLELLGALVLSAIILGGCWWIFRKR